MIINDPDYAADARMLAEVSRQVADYSRRHSLLKAPNPVAVFFRPGDDRRISEINGELEAVIEDLSNSNDMVIIDKLNSYPLMATHAHTRPFRQKWLNAVTGLVLPAGLFFYLRMWRFRLRLYKDLRTVRQTNDAIVARIGQMEAGKA